MSSDNLFHGISEGQTAQVEIDEGKVLIVSLIDIGKIDAEGCRVLSFEVNGNRRTIRIKTNKPAAASRRNLPPNGRRGRPDANRSSIPGSVLKILGRRRAVVEGQPHGRRSDENGNKHHLPVAGNISSILVKEGEKDRHRTADDENRIIQNENTIAKIEHYVTKSRHTKPRNISGVSCYIRSEAARMMGIEIIIAKIKKSRDKIDLPHNCRGGVKRIRNENGLRSWGIDGAIQFGRDKPSCTQSLPTLRAGNALQVK